PELVEAIEELGGRLDQPFEVRIAGTGKLVDAVHALAAKYKQVTYLGYVSEVEKRELLSGSDIFVLPTHAEGLPIALLEGMAGGNAVVTTPVGSIPEVIDDEGALLVESGSVAELTDAMERLITDPERVDMMGRHNRAVVEDRYAWSVVVDHVLATYRTALDDRPMEPSSRGDTERATVEVGPLEAGVGATSTHRQEVHHETD
ncbi:MAG: glycosyltransferase family 4 protein, partial [Halobacteriota archaeon]